MQRLRCANSPSQFELPLTLHLQSQSLIKHLSYLRDSYDIKPTPPTHPIPSSPRARRREPSVDPESGSPLFLRVARPPNVPGIHEEDEPSSDEQQRHASPISKRSKGKPRLSASKLPLPTRSTSPARAPTPMIGHQNTENISASLHPSKPRKTLRRPSGLLEINTEALSVPRSASPAFGSPIRLEAGRAEEAEEYAAIHGEIGVVIIDQNEDNDAIFKKEKRKGKSRELRESGSERDGSGDVRPRERTKHRDEVEPSDLVKLKSRDSSVTRTALQPIDSNGKSPTLLLTCLLSILYRSLRPHRCRACQASQPPISAAKFSHWVCAYFTWLF